MTQIMSGKVLIRGDKMDKIKKFFNKLKTKEFSKIAFVIVAAIIFIVAIYSVIDYYILCRLAINTGSTTIPDCALPVASVGSLLLLYLQYCLYQFGLKNSRNKYKVDEKGIPFIDADQDLGIDKLKQIISDFVSQNYGDFLEVEIPEFDTEKFNDDAKG